MGKQSKSWLNSFNPRAPPGADGSRSFSSFTRLRRATLVVVRVSSQILLRAVRSCLVNSPLRLRIIENASRRREGKNLDRTVIARIAPTNHDPRLPMTGRLLIKEFQQQTHVVKVLDDGFEYGGARVDPIHHSKL